jgi:hypothetical protein
MMDFLNGPIIPLVIVIVGVILFVVLYKKTNKQINQKRADIQRKIIEEYEKNSKK